MSILEAVRDHYVARWGKPSRTAPFQVGEYKIKVFKWEFERTGEAVDLYATLGACSWRMPGSSGDHRIEYIVGLRPGRDEIASPLAALGLYAQREGVIVDHGHTVPADGPLWPRTSMRTFLVLRQSTEILPALRLPNGAHVEFLQAIPIFDAERRYKRAHGVKALLDLWEARGARFWDPNRLPEPPA